MKEAYDHVYQVEVLRNGEIHEEHASRLKFYCDEDQYTESIMPFALSSEKGMPVRRLMHLGKF